MRWRPANQWHAVCPSFASLMFHQLNGGTLIMRSLRLALVISAGILIFISQAPSRGTPMFHAGQVADASHLPPSRPEAYGILPLSFEINRGQADGQIRFLSRGSGYSLFLTATEAIIRMRNAECGMRNADRRWRIDGRADPSSILDPGSSILNTKSSIFDPRSSILDLQPSILDLQSAIRNAQSAIRCAADEARWRQPRAQGGRVGRTARQE